MDITRVGFGAWAIGGGDWAVGWGDQEDADSIAAIRHAVERGVNWIDTAAAYGLGHSEEVVGRALREMPEAERPFVFTKCGLVWDEAERNALPKRIGRPESIRTEVEASLKRLGVERIDLYQMHWPAEDGTPVEEYWQALQDLKQHGKIRAAGLSNHTPDQLDAAERFGHVDSVQPPFSAIRRGAAEKEIAWSKAHETGVIVYSPMQSGLLTGTFSQERAQSLPGNDWRSRADAFRGEALTANLSIAEAMRPIAERHGTTVPAVAVAWTLTWPGVTGAIVGARRPDQVDGWIDAGRLDLTGGDLRQIAAAIEASGAGSGPVSPI
ncbi:aldo/keto reductase [Pararhizobium mangrovi]|uniref:Aldo/keto reductase n=2 Tax=Pararhizobium mangrovi TaxID=2590452 RepID=A0A506UEI6_9HYPH|nr:aldo/keto reductase [Pararhizobium mangrovi]